MVVAGSAHSLALEHQGRVFSWGLNESGQLGISDAQLILGQDQIGLGHTNNVPLITQVPGLTKITKIWATINGSLALNDQGQVYEWGSLVSGSCSIFPLLLEMERVVTISPRWDGCLFLTSTGSVRGFGANQNNRMGLAGPGVISLPIPDKIIDLCLSQDHSWFLTDQGEVYVLGNLGPLTQYSEDHRTMLPLRVPELTKIISMISTPYDMIFIDSQRKALTLSHYNTLAYLRGSSHLLQISPHHFINFQFGSNFCPLFLNRAGKLLENLMSKLILLGEAEVY
jgi:alpha-tubulin suppressor-like RCC1 family protein